MKKFRYIIPAVISIMLVAAGCSKNQEFGEEYNPDYDYQYTYMDGSGSIIDIQSSPEGEYLYRDSFIYYYNESTGDLNPLCSKANCLHDKETDADKIKECNAYADMEYNTYKAISYYDGSIYFYEDETEKLYRVSGDGRKKEMVLSLPERTLMESWCIHRGYFYYYIRDYITTSDGNVVSRANIKRLKPGNNMNDKKAEIVFQTDETVSVADVILFIPYKDRIYFSIYAYDATAEYDGSDDMVDIMLFCYDINKKTINRIEVDETEQYGKYTFIANILPFGDRLLLQLFDFTKLSERDYKFPVYITDMDFQNVEVFLDGIEQGRVARTFGDKLIIPLNLLEDYESVDDSMEVEVYDANAELIDTFVYPLCINNNLRGCGRNGKILEFIIDDENWYIKGFDLNTVGNYNGAVVELEDMAEREKRNNY